MKLGTNVIGKLTTNGDEIRGKVVDTNPANNLIVIECEDCGDWYSFATVNVKTLLEERVEEVQDLLKHLNVDDYSWFGNDGMEHLLFDTYDNRVNVFVYEDHYELSISSLARIEKEQNVSRFKNWADRNDYRQSDATVIKKFHTLEKKLLKA